MQEKRFDKRIPIGMALSISDLYKDGVEIYDYTDDNQSLFLYVKAVDK